MSFLLRRTVFLSWDKCNKKFRDNYGEPQRRYVSFVSVCIVSINLWINAEQVRGYEYLLILIKKHPKVLRVVSSNLISDDDGVFSSSV